MPADMRLWLAMQQLDGITATTLHEVDGRFVSGDLLTRETIRHRSIYTRVLGSPQTRAVERPGFGRAGHCVRCVPCSASICLVFSLHTLSAQFTQPSLKGGEQKDAGEA
jgi:hypothetical protein